MFDERKIRAAEEATDKVFGTLDRVFSWGILLACIGLVGWVSYNLLEAFDVTGLKLWGLTAIIGLIGGWILKKIFYILAWFA